MAKVPFSKLEAKVCDTSSSPFYYNTKNEEVYYEVKHYLPVEEKMEMISRIINQSIDENGFYNPMRVKIFTVLEVTYAYTNLSFTAKQKENIFKLYDQLISTGIFQAIKDSIYKTDWIEIEEAVIKTIDNIYKYNNSVMGVLENVVNDYKDLDLNATNIQSKLADPDNLAFLKDVLVKLG